MPRYRRYRRFRYYPKHTVSGRHWSREEELRLIQLRKSGMSINQIASELNRDHDAVYYRLIKLNSIHADQPAGPYRSPEVYAPVSHKMRIPGVLIAIILLIVVILLLNSIGSPVSSGAAKAAQNAAASTATTNNTTENQNSSTLNLTAAAKNLSHSISSTISNVSASLTQSTSINDSWANQFFANVSSQRGSDYAYCPVLSQFAEIRFNSQISNYEISHYGVQQDQEKYGIYDAEEVLFPQGYTPSGYATELSTVDPLHWQLLVDNSYTYYGYYIGNGPNIESYCPPSTKTEIPGPDVNVSQYLQSQGCTPITGTATYFMVELDNVCPSTI